MQLVFLYTNLPSSGVEKDPVPDETGEVLGGKVPRARADALVKPLFTSPLNEVSGSMGFAPTARRVPSMLTSASYFCQ